MTTVYCCKSCRKALFLDSAVSTKHLDDRGGERMFQGKSVDAVPQAVCTSFFLSEIPAWLKESLSSGAVQGKLLCDCGSKFGYYDWKGGHCSCGAWVTPSIQVPKSKVDMRRI